MYILYYLYPYISVYFFYYLYLYLFTFNFIYIYFNNNNNFYNNMNNSNNKKRFDYMLLGDLYRSYHLYFHALEMYQHLLQTIETIEIIETSDRRDRRDRIEEEASQLFFAIAQCFELLPTIFYQSHLLLVSLPTATTTLTTTGYLSFCLY